MFCLWTAFALDGKRAFRPVRTESSTARAVHARCHITSHARTRPRTRTANRYRSCIRAGCRRTDPAAATPTMHKAVSVHVPQPMTAGEIWVGWCASVPVPTGPKMNARRETVMLSSRNAMRRFAHAARTTLWLFFITTHKRRAVWLSALMKARLLPPSDENSYRLQLT